MSIKIFFPFTIIHKHLISVLRELASDEMLHWGDAPLCKEHGLLMQEIVLQNEKDGSKGQAIYTCKLPVRLGKCAEKWLLCHPISREPLMRTDTQSGLREQYSQFVSIFAPFN